MNRYRFRAKMVPTPPPPPSFRPFLENKLLPPVKLSPFYEKILRYIDTHPDPMEIASYVRKLGEQAAQSNPEYLGPSARISGHRAYDEIIADIFTSVVRAKSRESLVEQVIQSLRSPDLRSPAACMFVLETTAQPGKEWGREISILHRHGLQEGTWEAFEQSIGHSLDKSIFLKTLLLKGISYDLWLSCFIDNYNNELDLPVHNAIENSTKGANYWISAISLPSHRTDYPNRCLIAIYGNKGDEDIPQLPAGASQEWRVFHFLGLAYAVLNQQLRNVAEEVHRQRQRLLSTLAPGILHHEIGLQIPLVKSFSKRLEMIAQRLHDDRPDEDTGKLLANAERLQGAARRLSDITHAFNNLERRRVEEEVSLLDILYEVHTLVYHRLGVVGADLQWSEEVNVKLYTDPALLLHLIINIVVNAINAFEESNSASKQPNNETMSFQKRNIFISLQDQGEGELPIVMEILNNGPPIPSDLLEKIFEKGFTTRDNGHGHGLYISRLIAQVLGGDEHAMTNEELPSEWNVGFCIKLPRKGGRHYDVISELA